MDHIPGPIMATVAPRTATMIAVNECTEQVKNTQIPTMAIVVPATGVHRPSSRNTPPTDAIRQGNLGANIATSRRCVIPQ